MTALRHKRPVEIFARGHHPVPRLGSPQAEPERFRRSPARQGPWCVLRRLICLLTVSGRCRAKFLLPSNPTPKIAGRRRTRPALTAWRKGCRWQTCSGRESRKIPATERCSAAAHGARAHGSARCHHVIVQCGIVLLQCNKTATTCVSYRKEN